MAAVCIDEKNFPDEAFRNYLITYIFHGKSIVPSSELRGITSLEVICRNIEDLSGIKLFQNLSYLDCSFNHIEVLDLSNNTQLEKVNCCGNNLKQIVTGEKQFISQLNCSYNKADRLKIDKSKEKIGLVLCFNYVDQRLSY